MPFAARWVGLEWSSLANEVKSDKDKYHTYRLFVKSKKNDTNELIYKTETHS